MKVDKEIKLIRFINDFSSYNVVLLNDDVRLVRNDNKIIMTISRDKDGSIVLKEFIMLLEGVNVKIEYNYNERTGHNVTFIIGDKPIWRHTEFGTPIDFNEYSFIKFLESIDSGDLPAPLAGYILPPLLPS